MTEQDILQLRELAEAGQVQFKKRIVSKDDKYEIGCEMVAFSNSRGGRLIISINDKEITHSANEFVITIPRKTDQVTNQAQLETDQAQQKTDPVSDQASQNTTKLVHNTDPASPKSEQPTDGMTQNTTKLAHKTDPATSKSERPTDRTAQNTTKLEFYHRLNYYHGDKNYISSNVNRRISILYFDRMLVLMQSTFSIKALWS